MPTIHHENLKLGEYHYSNITSFQNYTMLTLHYANIAYATLHYANIRLCQHSTMQTLQNASSAPSSRHYTTPLHEHLADSKVNQRPTHLRQVCQYAGNDDATRVCRHCSTEGRGHTRSSHDIARLFQRCRSCHSLNILFLDDVFLIKDISIIRNRMLKKSL